MSDEMWNDETLMEHQVEMAATEDQYLEFLAALQALVRSEHLAPEDRLSALHQALDRAIGGNVFDAKDWAERVTLGLLEP